jgi:hypothetical protein
MCCCIFRADSFASWQDCFHANARAYLRGPGWASHFYSTASGGLGRVKLSSATIVAADLRDLTDDTFCFCAHPADQRRLEGQIDEIHPGRFWDFPALVLVG